QRRREKEAVIALAPPTGTLPEAKGSGGTGSGAGRMVGAAAPFFQQALIAYNAGDVGAALELWTRAAETGDASAQLLVGNMYLSGEGLEAANPEIAAGWFERSARGGNDEARVQLATLLRLGHGVPQDYRRAVALLYEAGTNGHAVAQIDLAELFVAGVEDRVAQNVPHAMDWYRLAGKQNVALAQVKLAQLHLEGFTGVPDEVVGLAWLNAAVRVALAPEEPEWSKRVLPLDTVIETDPDGRTLRRIIFDMADSYRAKLSELQLKQADAYLARLDLAPL
ncbi:MAG: sel1 repeat family protein, partial [Alphaproteobacteria bacterium]|nr:sel1 repeat family protein [Alphaproteobacteria bacterium]